MTGNEVRSILIEKGFVLAEIADKLGITAQTLNSRLNAKNFKNEYISELSSVEEVMIISKATNIDLSELIGISLPRQSEVPTPITNERLFSVIESQQRTIENLSKK